MFNFWPLLWHFFLLVRLRCDSFLVRINVWYPMWMWLWRPLSEVHCLRCTLWAPWRSANVSKSPRLLRNEVQSFSIDGADLGVSPWSLFCVKTFPRVHGFFVFLGTCGSIWHSFDLALTNPDVFRQTDLDLCSPISTYLSPGGHDLIFTNFDLFHFTIPLGTKWLPT